MDPRLLVVASEAVPFAKTGGLGDVISPMARAIARRGVRTCLLLPAYPSALRHAEQAGGATEAARLPDLPGGPGRLLAVQDGAVTVLLLQTARFDGREGLYADPSGQEYTDAALRFADLAHAADRLCAGRTPLPTPQAVHLHDWHTALVPMVQRSRGEAPTPSVLTLHNLAFQGLYPMGVADGLGLGGLAGEAEFWGRFSFLKAGLRFADRLTTVSRSYAQEILTPRFGCGLHDVLREREADLSAIANGIDTACWSPAAASLLPAPFTAADRRGKAVCKAALQAAFGLPAVAGAPLLALGSRLTHQKMADVALDALPRALAAHPRLQVAVHGCGERDHEQRFERLAEAHPGRVGVRVGYEEPLAHLLHAGADLLLHGSRFEPFGLTPIYAMRHGCVPIASRVGGLRDTIVDAGDAAVPVAAGSGVLFDGEGTDDMLQAIDRALALIARPPLRRLLQRNGMRSDFGWDGPAAAYLSLYAGLVAPAHRAGFEVAARADAVAQQEGQEAQHTPQAPAVPAARRAQGAS